MPEAMPLLNGPPWPLPTIASPPVLRSVLPSSWLPCCALTHLLCEDAVVLQHALALLLELLLQGGKWAANNRVRDVLEQGPQAVHTGLKTLQGPNGSRCRWMEQGPRQAAKGLAPA